MMSCFPSWLVLTDRLECKFNLEAPNVLHMTIKPQEIIDEEENAKSGKGGFGPGSGRDSGDRTPGCRCIIL